MNDIIILYMRLCQKVATGSYMTKLQQGSDDIVFVNYGNVHKDFEAFFTSPTVFTTWSFRIPPSHNPGLDLTQLEEIEIRFSGSFVTPGYAAPQVECKMKAEDV